MPRIQEIGPASTPILFLENQNQVEQQRFSQQYEDLQQQYRRQQIDYETAAKEIADMQAESDAQTEAFQSNMRMMQQSQKFVDMGLLSPEGHQEAAWRLALRDQPELLDEMYPRQAADPQRAPFSPGQMETHQEYIEDFVKKSKGPTRKKFGIDWLAKDVHTQKSLLRLYNTWKVNVGYNAMTASQQGQVDNEWDAWIVGKKGWDWNPNSKEVLAARGKGPLTRGYGSQFRGTPTGPREAITPLQSSIALSLPKQPKPKKEPQPRIYIRNRSTKKRMFSDDGGQTWQTVK